MAKENFDHLKVLAGQGNAEAQFQLGEYYFEQRSEAETEEDEDKVSAECLKWYTKAAEHGYAIAQYNLGRLYFHSENFTMAAKWYTKAAEQEDEDALVELGYLYFKGLGVQRNKALAEQLFNKVEDRGRIDVASVLYSLSIEI